MKHSIFGLSAGAALLVGTFLSSSIAWADDPLMGKAPWSFTPQNRAAIAVAIKNVEDGSAGGAGSGGGTTVLCGGTTGAHDGSTGAGTSATANNNCIIVTNSPGATVGVDQQSDGDQNAGSDVNATTTNNGAPNGSIDEVAAILGSKH